jgi:hypothetical protein
MSKGKKEIIEVRDPELSARTRLEPTFEWVAFPALTWAFYTLGSASFADITSDIVKETTEPDDIAVLAVLGPGMWALKNIIELMQKGIPLPILTEGG